ncbi:hypothetical protein SVAN01_05516 [Stagonosporopsis vannaccii]|nr:hypothetical protein SVAN01_05516 [Stagonosporopsis vannaccii]
MANLAHFLRGLLLPLAIALALYLATTLLLLPFIRRHRTRYTQYLPTPNASALTTHATTWRTTLSDALYTLFMPSTWTRQPAIHVHADSSDDDDDDDDDFDDEQGEGMVGFEPVDQRRREALDARRSLVVDEQRRLGRDLEQGFRDDSSDDEGAGHGDESRRSLSVARPRAAG